MARKDDNPTHKPFGAVKRTGDDRVHQAGSFTGGRVRTDCGEDVDWTDAIEPVEDAVNCPHCLAKQCDKHKG